MAKYIYYKYNAKYNPPIYKISWISGGVIHGWSNVCRTLNFNSSTGSYSTSNCGITLNSSTDDHSIGSTFYKIDGSKLRKFEKYANGSNGYHIYSATVYLSRPSFYSKGEYLDKIIAEEGTYPDDGRHTDGYWYVKGELAFPEFFIKINGEIKTATQGWIKINGELREIRNIVTKINGELKEVQ